MEVLEQLSMALGLGSLAGLNLYLTVFIAGLAIRMGWLDLAAQHEALATLGNPWVIGVAGGLFAIEFFADKVPWVDSVWDLVHTIVRPAGAVFLTMGVLGELDPVAGLVAALIGGGAALTTHSAKAGTRLLINLSPEPVSNAVASTAEDGVVLGGLSLMALAPVLGLVVGGVLVAVALGLIMKVWKFVRARRFSGKERTVPATA